MKIEITNDDIDLGDSCDCNTCAAALAINRVAPVGWAASVTAETIKMSSARGSFEFDAPQALQRFICDFDRWAGYEEMRALGHPLLGPGPLRPEPMTFELPLEELAAACPLTKSRRWKRWRSWRRRANGTSLTAM